MRLRCVSNGSPPRLGLAVAGVLLAELVAGSASADEPRLAGEPRVLFESTELTRVVDAFDEGNLFDLHLSLGYRHSAKRAKVYREGTLGDDGVSTENLSQPLVPVAQYTESTNLLEPRMDIGLYHDVALVVRMPIILSNDRRLTAFDGSNDINHALAGASGEGQLFSLPFESPTRSGIEYLALGFDVGIMNQYRDRSMPTWVFGLEGQFNVSEPMRACNANPAAGQVKCAHPADVNRNGTSDSNAELDDPAQQASDVELEGAFEGKRSPGVSRGMTGLELHTYVSKRVKYIEPYGGFRANFEFPNASSDYGRLDLRGTLVSHPPLQGTMIGGLAVVPWEVRSRMQRVLLDFRFEGSYRSEGQDYSELFDALGSSDAPSLRLPHYDQYVAGPEDESVVDTGSRRVYFTGLTDVQQHLIWKLQAEVTWQAGEYVRFKLGGAYTQAQSHIITNSQSCNPDFDPKLSEAGRCRTTELGDDGEPHEAATGLPNPSYRSVIDAPGRRYRVSDTYYLDAWLRAIVMF